MAQPTIVTATGVAAAGVGRPGVKTGPEGNALEQAMSNAIVEVQRETEAIARDEKDPAKKAARIAALNHPDNVRKRMLQARDVAAGKVKA